MVLASARANIALVKYWGKRDLALNLPAAGSLSLTLDALRTETKVELIEGSEDRFFLDGQQQNGKAQKRVSDFVSLLRKRAGRKEAVRVDSSNNFPTAAGLASSASAFAALSVAASQAFELQLSPEELSIYARIGSGSAARSIFGGYALMSAGEKADGSDAFAKALPEIDLPLSAAICLAGEGQKHVGSTEGMERTRTTSPYYQAWIEQVHKDLAFAQEALRQKDISALAEIVEGNCLAMHANAMSARPGIIYFKAVTLWAIEQVRQMRSEGIPVFFTIDAGPHVVAFCAPEVLEKVSSRLSEHPEVSRVVTSQMGGPAQVEA